MQHSKNLRIVIFSLGFETLAVIQPIDHYKADKAYMLGITKPVWYKKFMNEIKLQLKKKFVDLEIIETEIFEFADCLKKLYRIIQTEKKLGITYM